jgi:hypothetical protein
LNSSFHFIFDPIVLFYLGVYPDVTIDEIFAPKTTAAAPQGTWSYEFTDADGPQLGTVALPGSEVLSLAKDPIILIAKNTDLNIQMTDSTETLLVIDRGDQVFETGKFFLFLSPEQQLSVLYMDELLEGYKVVGKVIVCSVPFTESMRPKPTGFAEEDE